MTDLVQRLRAAAAQGMDVADIHCNIELEAAEHIEQLEEQLKTSRGLRDSQHAMIEAQTQRVIALEAALREIAACPMNCSGVASQALEDNK